MNVDDSWEVDEFEAVSDDEGGILIVPVSDNSASDSNSPHPVPTLYLPNQGTPSANVEDNEEHEQENPSLSPRNAVPGRMDVQEAEGVLFSTFGSMSNPRRLLMLILSLAFISVILMFKAVNDHSKFRELEKAAREAEILHSEQIRLLQEQYENSKDQESCWTDPASCGKSFLSKQWQTLSDSASQSFLGCVDPEAHRRLDKAFYAAFDSAVDTTLNHVETLKDTAMRKALSSKERLSKKVTSLAEFASERFENLQTGTASASPKKGLSFQSISNSTVLKVFMDNKIFKAAAAGTAAALVAGTLFDYEPFIALFDYEPFVGEV